MAQVQDYLYVVQEPSGKAAHKGYLGRAAALQLASNRSYAYPGTWRVYAPLSETLVASYRNGKKVFE